MRLGRPSFLSVSLTLAFTVACSTPLQSLYRDASRPVYDIEDSAGRYLPFAVEFAKQHQYIVGFNAAADKYGGGVTNTNLRVILICPHIRPAEQFYILLHELGHVLQPEDLETSAEEQVFAEAVAFVAGTRLGLRVRGAALWYMRIPQTFEGQEIMKTRAEEIETAGGEIAAYLKLRAESGQEVVGVTR